MHHSDFIRTLCSIYQPQLYVELGVYQGETWDKVKPFCKRMIGVDIKDNGVEGDIRIQSTTEFFKTFQDTPDFVFIDADHSYKSVLADFCDALICLTRQGVVILHDTDPINDKLLEPGYCSDSYRIVRQVEQDPNLNITTFPIAEAGLSMVTRKNNTRCDARKEYEWLAGL